MELTQITGGLLQNTTHYIEEHYQEIEKQWMLLMEKCLEEYYKCQKKIAPIPLQMIAVTFLNTAVYFGEPVIRVWFYGKDKIWEEPLLIHDMECEWIFQGWQGYSEALKAYGQEKRMKEEETEVLKRKMLRVYMKYISCYMKYLLRGIRELAVYKSITKAKDMMVTFGEYMDWQQRIVIEREEIDIFQHEEEESLQYRSFTEKVYKNKKFFHMDFTGSVFLNCKFENCEMEKVWIHDAIFQNCKFEKVHWKQCEFYGATFVECSFRETDFCEVKEIQENVAPEELKSLYKPVEYVECTGLEGE